MADESLVYAYVEFNPCWIYHGWHFYTAPVVDGKPARDKWDWLNKMHWKLDNLMSALGLPVLGEYRGDNSMTSVDAFLAAYPNGALLLTDGRKFRAAPDDCGATAWRCLQWVRQEQLLGVAEPERRRAAR